MRNLFIVQLALVIGLFTACYENGYENSNEDLILYELSEDLGMLDVIHDKVFKELYKKSAGKNLKTRETVDYTINGPEGGSARVVKSKVRNVENNFPYYDDSYIITCSDYKESGYVINGSISFYTGIRYDSIPSPRTVDFIYSGGGEGGSLTITGRTSMTVPVTIEVLNMLDDIEYHFNEVLVVEYGVPGTESKREMKMLAGLYRKTFRDAHNGLTMTGSNSDSISIDGPQGGSANLSTTRRTSGANTIQTETFTFANYKDNDLILNGTLSRNFMYNTVSGDIVAGCSEEHYMDVTGLYETSVKHILMIHKPFSIWNFRMGYFVNGFYYESVSILLNVGVGVGR
ncbi:MAG: hypothetical protein GY855_13525 [candidate division Zixibacteria bacterium]|nr:hypothetical protein [candidate division Zixibacteria bacterium]